MSRNTFKPYRVESLPALEKSGSGKARLTFSPEILKKLRSNEGWWVVAEEKIGQSDTDNETAKKIRAKFFARGLYAKKQINGLETTVRTTKIKDGSGDKVIRLYARIDNAN